MSGDFVLVVDADLSAYRAMVEGLPSDTYDVVSVATARAGFNVACLLDPHVIVASLDLPDADAMELAGVIRGHDTRVAYTPLVVLTTKDDEATRLAVLGSGADVVLSAPVDPAELVAQVNAMIAMTERIREIERAQSILPPTSDGQAYALLGDPAKMSIASVLGALELEKRSGELRFTASGSGQRLSIYVASGVIAGGLLDGVSVTPLDALKAGLQWSGNQFGFVAGEPQPPPSFGQALGSLLIAAFSETAPSDRIAHEWEASRRILGETAAGRDFLADSIAGFASQASVRLGETASGLRLEDTAAGRRFLQDTAAGLRLGVSSPSIRLGETASGLRLGDTTAGLRLGDTTGGKVAAGPSEWTNTLTSFHAGSRDDMPPVPEPPAARKRASKPDLSAERAAMRQTFRGLEVDSVRSGKMPNSSR